MNTFKFLTEITISQIQRNNETGFPNTKKRQHVAHLVNAKGLKFEPFEPSNTLIVTASTRSNNQMYDSSLEFTKVNYHDKGLVAFKGTDNQIHRIDKLSYPSTDVSVNCTCLDFRFRFAHQHYQNNSLVGDAPEPYVKVPGSNRPPVNPGNVLGVCKHVLALAEKLRSLRVIS